MFNSLRVLPADPLLGLITKYNADSRSEKLDLGVGVYKDEEGSTNVLRAVKNAESFLLNTENSKAYVGPAGNKAFTSLLADLIFGSASVDHGRQLFGLQTPGGCGALRVLAELIKVSSPAATVWVSTPTWANHIPLMGGAGLAISEYPYYDMVAKTIRFPAMLETLEKDAKPGDVILVHACCHNPSGADLTQSQWRELIELCKSKRFVPLIDLAYQGFGDSLKDDAFGIRWAVDELPELLVASSCSKNFGLYRERVGAAYVKSESSSNSEAVASHLLSITRGIYSMPPSHGASIVETILASDELSALWQRELWDMRERIQDVRKTLSESLRQKTQSDTFDFIAHEKGMFSFLGVDESLVGRLAINHGIYMAGTSRMNVAGLSHSNIDYFCEALAKEME